ncbi:EAL domain-containing protein [Spiroplasma endosymbiont of Aspidapion aeneum]|uniref:EAL domain-containing protein n=1 Tax=Spiroplasma endosymbiont of Aspidapion aeneum TaxID=3066276 RepID=UPI00313C308D
MGIYNLNNIYGDFIYYIPIIVYFTAISFISEITAGIILITNLFCLFFLYKISSYFIYFYQPSNITTTFVICCYITITLTSVIKKFFNKFKLNELEFILINTLILLLTSMLFKLIWKGERFNITFVIFFILLLYLSAFLAIIIDSIYYRALNLSNIVIYDEKYYLNPQNIYLGIMQFLKSNKTRLGIYFNFFIADYDDFENKMTNEIKEAIINDITETFYNEIEKNIENNKIYLRVDRKTYGVFIDISDEINNIREYNIDPLDNLAEVNRLNNIMDNIITNYKIKSVQIKINLKSIYSIYGVDSSDIEKLFNLNNWYVANEKKLIVGNFKQANIFDYNKNKKLKRKIIALGDLFNINEINFLYNPIYSIGKKLFTGYIINTYFSGRKIVFSKDDELVVNVDKAGLGTILMRYIANKQLISLNGNCQKDILYFINYDTYALSSNDFNINEFNHKLSDNNVKGSSLVLLLNHKADVDSVDNLKKNIKQLKQNKIRTCVNGLDLNDIDTALFKYLSPDYVTIDNEKINRFGVIKEKEKIINSLVNSFLKINCNLIITNVRRFSDYVLLKKNRIKFISGPIIGTDEKLNSKISKDLKILFEKGRE